MLSIKDETHVRTLILNAENERDILTAGKIIASGGLVAFPTETVYGLGADALNPEAVARIFTAKGRPQDNPLIVHIADISQLDGLAREIPETAKKLAGLFWPGPFTMVLKKRINVPGATTAGLDTVAVRCPKNKAALALIKAAGAPIAAPSANRSGKPSPTKAAHVKADMDGRVDAILDGGDCEIGLESTVIDLTCSPARLLRPGGIGADALKAALGDIAVDGAIFGEMAQGEKPRAPGMKYRHYAPRARVIIVNGTAKNAADFVRSQLSPGVWALCFDEEDGFYDGVPHLCYGRSDDPKSLAGGLFSALRQLDRADVTTIYARCPTGGGLNDAVRNRLMKAAGFTQIGVDA